MTAPDPKITHYAASAAVWRGETVLLVKRGGAPAPGKWALPGGKLEPGESALEAALREVLEETRVVAEIERQIDTFVFQGRPVDGGIRTYHLSVFSGSYVSGTAVAGDDAAEVAWVAPPQFAEYDLTPDRKSVV